MEYMFVHRCVYVMFRNYQIGINTVMKSNTICCNLITNEIALLMIFRN